MKIYKLKMSEDGYGGVNFRFDALTDFVRFFMEAVDGFVSTEGYGGEPSKLELSIVTEETPEFGEEEIDLDAVEDLALDAVEDLALEDVEEGE